MPALSAVCGSGCDGAAPRRRRPPGLARRRAGGRGLYRGRPGARRPLAWASSGWCSRSLCSEATAWRRLRLLATLNLEGSTIPEGELTPGAWGEGFIDRRHPHTYVHELLLSGATCLALRRPTPVSLTAGKGFAPFGTDDPMMRPLAAVSGESSSGPDPRARGRHRRGAARAGHRGGGLFNGDEPERPGQWPRLGGRFGDSWAARLTAAPIAGLELQVSHADVHVAGAPARVPAPTRPSGACRRGGTDRSGGAPVSGLVEWARTSEAGGFFVFHSVLAEGAWSPGAHRLHYRFERTERPEEERPLPFPIARPHLENSILGTTRWTMHTAGYELQAPAARAVTLRPLVELSLGSVAKVGGGLFEVDQLYGGDGFWSLSVGLRVAAGAAMPRMGRYGDARAGERDAQHQH